MADTLRECPGCGKTNAKTRHIRDGRQAICPDCCWEGPPAFHGPDGWENTDKRAIEAWNTRASPWRYDMENAPRDGSANRWIENAVNMKNARWKNTSADTRTAECNANHKDTPMTQTSEPTRNAA